MAMAAMVDGQKVGRRVRGVEWMEGKTAAMALWGGGGGVYQGFKGRGERPAPSTVTPDVPNGYLPLVLSSLQHHLGLAADKGFLCPPAIIIMGGGGS
jgi:hypothetical protein